MLGLFSYRVPSLVSLEETKLYTGVEYGKYKAKNGVCEPIRILRVDKEKKAL